MKKLTVKFASEWVLSRREDPVLPVEAFLEALHSFVEIQVLEKEMTGCSVIIKKENYGTARIRHTLQRILSTKFQLTVDSPEFSYSIEDYQGSKRPEQPTFEDLILDIPGMEDMDEKPVRTVADLEREEQERKAQLLKETIDKIEALVGAEDFKALARVYRGSTGTDQS